MTLKQYQEQELRKYKNSPYLIKYLLEVKEMIKKIINNGKLLEIIKSTEAQMEYMHYFYNNKFYRLVKHMGEIIQVIKIKRENLSELAIYNLMK